MRSALLCVIVFIVTGGTAVYAQRMYGVTTGMQPNLSSLSVNPASIGGFNGDYSISILGINLLFDNNLGTLNSVGQVITQLNNSDNSPERLFKFSGNTKFDMLAPMAELKGPGVIFPVDDQNALAITTSFRAFNEFHNFDRLLYQVTYNVPNTPSFAVNTQNFKWTMHAWSQLGFSYGGIIMNRTNSQLKMGLSLNLLGGIGYAGLSGNTLNINYNAGADSFALSGADVAFSSSLYTGSNRVRVTDIIGNLAGRIGSGVSFNAGLIWMTKAGKPLDDEDDLFNYKVAVSLAIADLGKVTYKSMITSSITGSGYFKGAETSEKVKSYNQLLDYISSRGYRVSTKSATLPVYLPMSTILGIDYQFGSGFYTNLNAIVNLANDANFGNRYYSQVTITPRYQWRKGSVGMPVTYNSLAHNIRMGVGVRYKEIVFGSDDILLFFTGNKYGFNLYAGLAFTFNNSQKLRK